MRKTSVRKGLILSLSAIAVMALLPQIYLYVLLNRNENSSVFVGTEDTNISNKKTAIVLSALLYGDDMNEMVTAVMNNHRLYAEKHDYTYLTQRDIDASFWDMSAFMVEHSKFTKVALLNYTLNAYRDSVDYILWMDGDTIFMNCNESIQSMVSKTRAFYATNDSIQKNVDPSLIISGDRNAIINDGVFILKNNEFSRRLVNDWLIISFIFFADPNKNWTFNGLTYDDLRSQFHIPSTQSDPHAYGGEADWADQAVLLQMMCGLSTDVMRNHSFFKSTAALFQHFRCGGYNRNTVTASQAKTANEAVVDPMLRNHTAFVPMDWINSRDITIKGSIEAAQKQWIIHYPGAPKQIKTREITKYVAHSNCNP